MMSHGTVKITDLKLSLDVGVDPKPTRNPQKGNI